MDVDVIIVGLLVIIGGEIVRVCVGGFEGVLSGIKWSFLCDGVKFRLINKILK